MPSYENHQALNGPTLGKPTDYRDNYGTSLLQGVPRSLNRDPLDLKADNLPFHSANIWTLYELSWLNVSGLPQVAVGRMESDHTSVNLVESKNFELYLNSFSQTRLGSQDAVHQALENDLRARTQDDVSVTLYCLDELEGQPITHFNGTCIDDQDIVIDNYQFSTACLENVVNGERAVEETLVNHLLKSNCPITRQPDQGSIQIQYREQEINRGKLLHYLISFRHHNEFHGQRVERISNDILRFCQLEKLSIYVHYTRRGGLDINPQHTNTDFTPATGCLVRQ